MDTQINKANRFNLAVIEPVKGHPGRLINTVTVWSDSLKSAIKSVKDDGAKDCVIVEKQSYERTLKEYKEKHAPKAA